MVFWLKKDNQFWSQLVIVYKASCNSASIEQKDFICTIINRNPPAEG